MLNALVVKVSYRSVALEHWATLITAVTVTTSWYAVIHRLHPILPQNPQNNTQVRNFSCFVFSLLITVGELVLSQYDQLQIHRLTH